MSQGGKVSLERLPVSDEELVSLFKKTLEFTSRFTRGQLPKKQTMKLLKQILDQEMPYSAPLMVALEIAENLAGRIASQEFHVWLAIYDVTKSNEYLNRAMIPLDRALEECSNKHGKLDYLLSSTAKMCYQLAIRRGYDHDRSGVELFERERSVRGLSLYEEYLNCKLLTLRDASILRFNMEGKLENANLSPLLENGQWGVYFLAIKNKIEKDVGVSAAQVFSWLNVQPAFAKEERVKCLLLAMKKFGEAEPFRALTKNALAESNLSFERAELSVQFAEMVADEDSFLSAVDEVKSARYSFRTFWINHCIDFARSLASALEKMRQNEKISPNKLAELKELVYQKIGGAAFNYAFNIALLNHDVGMGMGLSHDEVSQDGEAFSPASCQRRIDDNYERIFAHMIRAQYKFTRTGETTDFELAYNEILSFMGADLVDQARWLCGLYRLMCECGIDKQSRKEREKKPASEKEEVGE